MKVKMTIKKAVCGFIIGGLVASGSYMAFASSSDSASATTNSTTSATAKNNTSTYQMGMKGLKFGGMRHGGKMGFGGQEDLKSTLDAMVKEGTITQAKVDQLTAYLTKKDEERKAQFDALKNLTPEERKAKMDEIIAAKPAERPDCMADAVKDGIITQQQADAIKAKMEAQREQERQDRLKADLSTVVKDGKITQAKADKIAEYVKKEEELRKAEFEKIKNMSQEERDAYIKKAMSEKKDILSQMVTDGVLTQAEADAVAKVLPLKGPHKGMGGRGHGGKGGFGGNRQ